MTNEAETDIPPATPTAPADSWAPAAVALLDEMAQMGMRLARSLARRVEADDERVDRGEPAQMSAADVSRTIRDFTRVSRCVRMSLSLKGRAQNGEPKASSPSKLPVRSEPFTTIPYEPLSPIAPDRRGKGAHEAFVAAEIRSRMEHLVAGPEREPAETERLRDRVEHEIARRYNEFEFLWGTTALLEKICKSLGIDCAWRAGLDERGQLQRWMVAAPGDDGSPLTVERTPLDRDDFIRRWGPPSPPSSAKTAASSPAPAGARPP